MKKTIKFIKFLLIVLILLGIAGASVLAATGKSKASFLRIRKSASTNSEVLAVLDEGETVEILGEEGDWYKVKAKGFTGYVSKEFINKNDSKDNNNNSSNTVTNTQPSNENNGQPNTDNSQNSNLKTTTVTKKVYKISEDTEVYILPILSSERIGNVPKEQEISLISSAGLWGYIKSATMSGWVRIDKLSSEDIVVNVQTENGTTQSNNNANSQNNSTATTENNNKNENTNTVNENNNQTTNTSENTTQTTNTSANTTQTTENVQSTNNNQKTENVQSANSNQTSENNNASSNNAQNNFKEKTMYTNATAVNVRSQSNTSSDIVSSVAINTQFTAVGEENGWYKVKVNGNTFGYIRKDLLSDKKTETTSRTDTINRNEATATQNTNTATNTKTQTTATNTQTQTTTSSVPVSSSGVSGTDIANYAKQFVGCKYVYGAAGPSSFDCSGLTMYVYKHFGYSLSHSSKVQATQGVKVTGELQPGDILIFSNDGKQVGHVGIYIGNDKFVHASDSTTGVIISNLHDKWNISKYWGARRIIK